MHVWRGGLSHGQIMDMTVEMEDKSDEEREGIAGELLKKLEREMPLPKETDTTTP